MTTTETTINGYRVEFEGPDDDGVTQCSVSKGEYYASLECLNGTGCLHNEHWDERPVPADIIERIYKWATEQGY